MSNCKYDIVLVPVNKDVAGDSQFIYNVRNHPAIRKNLINESEIPISKHNQYWSKLILSNDVVLYKIEMMDPITHQFISVGYCDTKVIGDEMEFGWKILPDYQGLGLGRKAVEALLNANEGYIQIKGLTPSLTVFDDNFPAIKLYQSFGFETVDQKKLKRLDGTIRVLLKMKLTSN